MVSVHKITDQKEMQDAFSIREEVFIWEQKVKKEDEFDEFEKTSSHFLATIDGEACGTARWRITSEGVKLERFAVLKSYRGKSVGSKLVERVLQDLETDNRTNGKTVYMHAQLPAIPLYHKFGFKISGDAFFECDIEHVPMKK